MMKMVIRSMMFVTWGPVLVLISVLPYRVPQKTLVTRKAPVTSTLVHALTVSRQMTANVTMVMKTPWRTSVSLVCVVARGNAKVCNALVWGLATLQEAAILKLACATTHSQIKEAPVMMAQILRSMMLVMATGSVLESTIVLARSAPPMVLTNASLLVPATRQMVNVLWF